MSTDEWNTHLGEEITSELNRIGTILHTITNFPDGYDIDGSLTIRSNVEILPIGIRVITGSFNCNNTMITSLTNAPVSVGSFDCSRTKITSLEGAPRRVLKYFDCSVTDITSFRGAPEYVGGNLHAGFTPITDVQHFPKYVGRNASITNTDISSLHNAHHYLHDVKIGGQLFLPDRCTHLLSLIYCNDISKIGGPAGSYIMNKHLAKKERDIFACQEELIEAGFIEQAKL